MIEDIVEELEYASANDTHPWDATLHERAANEIKYLREKVDVLNELFDASRADYNDLYNARVMSRREMQQSRYRFTEVDLRNDIVSIWGEYGAHVLVFDYILTRLETMEEVNRFFAELESDDE